MEKKKIKLHVVGRNDHYAEPFLDMFDLVKKEEDADVLMFTGGADVSPFLYGKEAHPLTTYDMRRDAVEKSAFDRNPDKLKIGICRGSQLLTVLSGGLLVQHVTGHAIGGMHKIIDNDSNEFEVTSTHHQMMNPFNMHGHEYIIMAYAKPRLSRRYEGENQEDLIEMPIEPEVVYYGKTNSLAVQFHPEMMEKESTGVLWLKELIKTVLRWQK
jgi:GMP synthase-like glutamine amidotransferase